MQFLNSLSLSIRRIIVPGAVTGPKIRQQNGHSNNLTYINTLIRYFEFAHIFYSFIYFLSLIRERDSLKRRSTSVK